MARSLRRLPGYAGARLGAPAAYAEGLQLVLLGDIIMEAGTSHAR